jgi:hypothetical protein
MWPRTGRRSFCIASSTAAGAPAADDHGPARHAGGRPRQHRRRADLLVRQHPEELAEPVEPLLEETRDRLVGRVPARDPVPPFTMTASTAASAKSSSSGHDPAGSSGRIV